MEFYPVTPLEKIISMLMVGYRYSVT